MDPLQAMAQDSAGSAQSAGAVDGDALLAPAPSMGQRVTTLFLPCNDDPLTYAGGMSRWIDGRLAQKSGVDPAVIHVGANVAHCLDHVLPGGGVLGWPPIVNLARAWFDFKDKAARERAPDSALVPRG